MEPTAAACWHHAMMLTNDKLSSPDDKLRTQGESLTTGICWRRCGQGQAAAAAPAAAGWLAARRHGAWLASTAYQHRLNHRPSFAPLHLPANFDKLSVLSPMQWRTGVNIVKHEVRFQPVPHRSYASAASLVHIHGGSDAGSAPRTCLLAGRARAMERLAGVPCTQLLLRRCVAASP